MEGGVRGLNPENRVKKGGSHDSWVEKKHFHWNLITSYFR